MVMGKGDADVYWSDALIFAAQEIIICRGWAKVERLASEAGIRLRLLQPCHAFGTALIQIRAK